MVSATRFVDNSSVFIPELRIMLFKRAESFPDKMKEVVSKRWHNLFDILQFCYIFFWLCCFFLMHLATSCYIPIISGYK